MFASARLLRQAAGVGTCFLCAAAVTALPSIPAQAGDGHVVQGLFCNTAAQVDQALELMRARLSPQAATAALNKDKVVCTYIDQIHYMVVRPVVLGRAGVRLTKYRAMLVAVLVGGKARPVDPSVPIFFLTTQELNGAVVLGGT
jgi:hypothetical protein